MFFKSIRFKVLLFYILLLSVTLLIFSTVLYGSFRNVLIGHLDDLLSSRAEGIADAAHTFWHAKEVGALDPTQLSDPGDNEGMSSFLDIARSWVEEKRKDPELLRVYAQLTDTKGNPLIATKAMPFVPPLSQEDLSDIISGEDSFDTVSSIASNGQKTKFRVYTKPVIEDGRVVYLVQVVGPIDLISLAMHNLIIVLFIMLPLTILLAGIPGVLLAGLTLRPVRSMIDTLRQITAENLKLKIHIPDTKDEIKRLADTFNDMIDRLDRSFSSQQNFIQDISFELRMPLLTLKEDLKSALGRSVSESEREALIKKAAEEADKFSNIIDDLLVLARFDNSQMPLEIKKVDLNRLLGGLVTEMKQRAEEKDIVLSSFLQERIILDGDELQFRRMFSNFLDNAVKYTNRKGRITVSLHREKRHARVSISDTGVGMPEDEIAYIFDRFYQINRSRSSKGGFGLGLSIAKSIIESHKGRVVVESAQGKGSSFIVHLPLSYPG